MLAWSVEAALAAAPAGPLLITAPPGHEQRVGDVAGPRAEILTGGATRADSVRLALERVDTDLVAIHDAARPLVGPGLLDAVLTALAGSETADAAIAAAPLGDTVKRAKPAERPGVAAIGPIAGRSAVRVAETVDRRDLWTAQTPQAFRTGALRRAQEAAAAAGELAAATDEAMLIERVGGEVLLVPAGAANPKVTLPEDLELAEALLLRRRPG